MISVRMAAKFYAVAVGRRTGVYRSWDECKAQVYKFPAAIHKAFKSEGEAAAFINQQRQSRGFAAGNSQPALAALPPPTKKRRRKPAAGAAASSVPVQERPTDNGRASDAEPDAVAANSADAGANDAAADEAHGAAVPSIWSSMLYRLEFDGASRGNPGLAGAGAALLEDGSRKEVGRLVLALQRQTNNVAEYCGLIIGLEAAVQLGIKRLSIIGDSKLVIKQAEGAWQCSAANLQPLRARAQSLMRAFDFASAQHVLRHNNKIADALSNEALDGAGWGGGLKLPDGTVVPIDSTLPEVLRSSSAAALDTTPSAAAGSGTSGRKRRRSPSLR